MSAGPAVQYLGDLSWAAVGEQIPRKPPGDLYTITEPWNGRQDQLSQFLTNYPVGGSYLGGTIIDNTPRNHDPCEGMCAVDLVVAVGCDTKTVLSNPGLSLSKATLSVQNKAIANVVPLAAGGFAANINASITSIYYAPEMRYTYMATSQPTKVRFTKVGYGKPAIIAQTIVATDAANSGASISFTGGVAPAGLVSALTQSNIDKNVGFNCEQIAGTTYYRCTETWRTELAADS